MSVVPDKAAALDPALVQDAMYPRPAAACSWNGTPATGTSRWRWWNWGITESGKSAHRKLRLNPHAVLLGIAETCRNVGIDLLAYLVWAFERRGTGRAIRQTARVRTDACRVRAGAQHIRRRSAALGRGPSVADGSPAADSQSPRLIGNLDSRCPDNGTHSSLRQYSDSERPPYHTS